MSDDAQDQELHDPRVVVMVERLGDLAERVTATEDVLRPLLTRFPEAFQEGPPSVPWRLTPVPDPLTLTSWIEYFNAVYTPNVAGLRLGVIPPCWELHPGLVAEIGTLYRTWRSAFYDEPTEPESAQNWHDRWLPGFMARRSQWIDKQCSDGNCPRRDDGVTSSWLRT